MLIRLLLLFAVAAAYPAGAQQGNSAPASPVPPARVYIYQLKIRGARANPIWCDEIQVARLRQRWSYFVVQIQPGEHSFRGRHKENELVLDVLPGQDYYLRLDQIMTYPGADKLVRERTEEGQATIRSGKLRLVDSNDILDRNRVAVSPAITSPDPTKAR